MPSKTSPTFMSIIAFLIIPISGLSIDIYIPSLPAVSDYFQTDNASVQLTITTYMLGLGFLQLFAGSVSDSFGRKRPFAFAMLTYIIATLLVPWSHTITQLQTLRFIQGVSAAMTVVPMRSVILDLYEGRELEKMMTYMTMTWSIGPIVAPAIGGYLQHFFGWKACFYFLAIYSTIGFLLALVYLPETSKFKHPFHVKKMIARYYTMLSHKPFSLGLIMCGMLYSLVILFSIVGPFFIQDILHFSAVDYGHISLLLGLAWFMGVSLNRFLLDAPLFKKVVINFIIMTVIMLTMIAYNATFPGNLYAVVIPVFMLFCFAGIVFPNYVTRNMALFPQMTASSNALFGSAVFLMTGAVSGLGTLLKSTSIMPLAWAYLGIMFLLWIILYVDHSKKQSVI